MAITDSPITAAERQAPELMLVLGGKSKGGRRNSNRGKKFPPNPINVEDMARLREACVPLTPGVYGYLSAERLWTAAVLMWRTGVRVSELLDLEDRDLSEREAALVVRNGKGGKRRIVLMDEWGWQELQRWLVLRREKVPPGKVIPTLRGVTAGSQMKAVDLRRQLHAAEKRAGIQKRLAPHQFRHGFAVEARREGLDFYTLMHQLGHANLGVTEVYFRGVDPFDVLEPVRMRRPPMVVLTQREVSHGR